MSIELVLHPLQGASTPWQSPVERLEIGRDPAADLPFVGGEHDLVSWRHARIEAQGGAYVLIDLGSTNKTYLNGAPVDGPRPLSAGDQVRLGLEGPRIDVVRLTLPGAHPAAPPVAPAATRAVAGDVDQTATLWPVAAAVGGIVAVGCLVGAVLYLATKSESTAQAGAGAVPPSASSSSDATSAGKDGDSPAEPAVASNSAAGQTQAKPAVATPPGEKIPPQESAQGPQAHASEALRAIVAEHPDGKLSALVTSACAVDSQTLLTTAGMAQELQSLRLAGWKIWAVDPVTRARLAVEEILVHVGFDQAQGQPAEQIYFDQARLTVEGKLPITLPLATAAEQARVEQGYPLTLLGFSHETGRPITRFDELNTLTAEGKVLAVTSLQPTSEAPRLLHVQGELSPNLKGGAVCDRQGKLLGLYVVETPPGVLPKIVYCTLVSAGTLGPDAPPEADKLWVVPRVEAAAAPETTASETTPPEEAPTEN